MRRHDPQVCVCDRGLSQDLPTPATLQELEQQLARRPRKVRTRLESDSKRMPVQPLYFEMVVDWERALDFGKVLAWNLRVCFQKPRWKFHLEIRATVARWCCACC